LSRIYLTWAIKIFHGHDTCLYNKGVFLFAQNKYKGVFLIDVIISTPLNLRGSLCMQSESAVDPHNRNVSSGDVPGVSTSQAVIRPVGRRLDRQRLRPSACLVPKILQNFFRFLVTSNL